MRGTIDEQPFADVGKYSFGSESERKKFEAPFITLTAPDTDQAGKSRLEWGGDKVKDTVLPGGAQLRAGVLEPGGGRATRADKTVPLRSRDVYLGVRPTFEGRYASEGGVTAFDTVAVASAGKQVARQAVEYRIERIDYNYQWYQVDGKWRWQSNQSERLLTTDSIALKADQPTRLSRQLNWGEYKLTIVDNQSRALSSLSFYVGWYGGSRVEETPDTLPVASDKHNYKPRENARLPIQPPVAGQALVAIAPDRLRATYP